MPPLTPHWMEKVEAHHMSFFFFQAEDGIRDVAVTGVQTCALPISPDTNKAATRTSTIARNERTPAPREDTVTPRVQCGPPTAAIPRNGTTQSSNGEDRKSVV